jgi:DNA-binding transcriptional ArsR family regulator
VASSVDPEIGLLMEAMAAPNRNDVSDLASTSDLVRALNHPTRRSILRFLLNTAPASSTAIRRGMPGLESNRINFHFETLVTTGAVTRHERQAGYRESFYSPTEAVRAGWC